uniref:Uncharacterized protein LOC105114717 isoform X1 n=1 Tax=Rhizophora mucronata TaxID=61149 RepID=A0A2P2MRX6_RHIMU
MKSATLLMQMLTIIGLSTQKDQHLSYQRAKDLLPWKLSQEIVLAWSLNRIVVHPKVVFLILKLWKVLLGSSVNNGKRLI